MTHKERIEIVNIVCNHMMIECNPQQHFPSVNTKHRYAEAIIKSFPCLATKQQDKDGGVSLNHDVFYHQVAGGFIENRLKEIRRKEGIRKRKPNGLAKNSESDGIPAEKKKRVKKLTKGVPKLSASADDCDEETMKSMVNASCFFLSISIANHIIFLIRWNG